MATAGLHTESFTVDNADGALGDYIGIEFTGTFGANWCDDGDSSRAAGMVFDGAGTGAFASVDFLRTDAASCSRTRDLIVANGQNFGLAGSVVLGGQGAVLRSPSGYQSSITVGMDRSSISGVTGQVLSTQGNASLVGCDITGCSTVGQPLIETTGVAPSGQGNANLEVVSTLIFGNVTSGAPVLRSQDRLSLIADSVLENVVIDAPLIELDQLSLNGQARSAITHLEVAGTRLLAAGAQAAPSTYVSPLLRPSEVTWDECLPEAAHGIDVQSRDLPVASGATSDEALLSLGDFGGIQGEQFRLLDSWFVDNELGPAGSVVRVAGAPLFSSFVVVHNVFDESVGALVDGGTGFGCRLSLGRNLLLGQPRLDLGSGWESIESSMDAVEGASTSWPQWNGGGAALLGPVLMGFDRASLRSEASVLALTDCERNQLFEPGQDSACTNNIVWCPLGAAAGYHLSAAAVPVWADAWPWSNTTLVTDPTEAPLCTAPGVAGPCVTVGGDDADGDDFSDIFDCDDNDAGVVPSLPVYDGFGGPWCEPLASECFSCPESSCWPPLRSQLRIRRSWAHKATMWSP